MFCAFNLFYLKKKDFLSSIGCIKLRSAFVFLSLSHPPLFSHSHSISNFLPLSLSCFRRPDGAVQVRAPSTRRRDYQLWANFGQGGPIDQLSPACMLNVYKILVRFPER